MSHNKYACMLLCVFLANCNGPIAGNFDSQHSKKINKNKVVYTNTFLSERKLPFLRFDDRKEILFDPVSKKIFYINKKKYNYQIIESNNSLLNANYQFENTFLSTVKNYDLIYSEKYPVTNCNYIALWHSKSEKPSYLVKSEIKKNCQVFQTPYIYIFYATNHRVINISALDSSHAIGQFSVLEEVGDNKYENIVMEPIIKQYE